MTGRLRRRWRTAARRDQRRADVLDLATARAARLQAGIDQTRADLDRWDRDFGRPYNWAEDDDELA